MRVLEDTLAVSRDPRRILKYAPPVRFDTEFDTGSPAMLGRHDRYHITQGKMSRCIEEGNFTRLVISR